MNEQVELSRKALALKRGGVYVASTITPDGVLVPSHIKLPDEEPYSPPKSGRWGRVRRRRYREANPQTHRVNPWYVQYHYKSAGAKRRMAAEYTSVMASLANATDEEKKEALQSLYGKYGKVVPVFYEPNSRVLKDLRSRWRKLERESPETKSGIGETEMSPPYDPTSAAPGA